MANRCSERVRERAVLLPAAVLIASGAAGAAWATAEPASVDRRNRYDVEQERLQRVTGEIDRLRSRLTSFRAREAPCASPSRSSCWRRLSIGADCHARSSGLPNTAMQRIGYAGR